MLNCFLTHGYKNEYITTARQIKCKRRQQLVGTTYMVICHNMSSAICSASGCFFLWTGMVRKCSRQVNHPHAPHGLIMAIFLINFSFGVLVIYPGRQLSPKKKSLRGYPFFILKSNHSSLHLQRANAFQMIEYRLSISYKYRPTWRQVTTHFSFCEDFLHRTGPKPGPTEWTTSQ